MYIGVDIGASKTLVAGFSDSLELIKQSKFATSRDPDKLVEDIFAHSNKLGISDKVQSIGVAVPGRLDDGLVTNTSTLQWQDVPLKKLLNKHTDVAISMENDAVLGGLSEARIGNGQGYSNMLYITISTGVGTGIIIDGQIPSYLHNSEGGHMLTDKDGRAVTIESLVSGSAFKQRFGKHGYETEDQDIWNQYGQDLARAVFDMSALLEPDCVIIGGGMAVHYDRFSHSLDKHLQQLEDGIFELPEVKPAKNPETAVIYGCAIVAKEVAS